MRLLPTNNPDDNRSANQLNQIEFQDVSKDYRKGAEPLRALNRINFNIQQGEFVALVGTSGSGKSTCLNILGCIDTPTCGNYYFEGVNVRSLSRDQLAVLRRFFLDSFFKGLTC